MQRTRTRSLALMLAISATVFLSACGPDASHAPPAAASPPVATAAAPAVATAPAAPVIINQPAASNGMTDMLVGAAVGYVAANALSSRDSARHATAPPVHQTVVHKTVVVQQAPKPTPPPAIAAPVPKVAAYVPPPKPAAAQTEKPSYRSSVTAVSNAPSYRSTSSVSSYRPSVSTSSYSSSRR